MAKDPEAPYEAGRRGAGWMKLKPSHTLDLVVLAVEWGGGRRRGWLSNLHLGARDEAGGFVMLGKTFKGMTDEMLCWQTAKLQELKVAEEGHVVHVRPELVVEVTFDGVQASPNYPGGMALRFARVKRYRPDKLAAQADTVAAVREIFSRSRVGRLNAGTGTAVSISEGACQAGTRIQEGKPMRTKRIVTLIGAVMLIVAVTSYAQRFGGGGGRGQAGGGMLPLESDWALISFELDVSPITLGKLRTVYQKAWDQRSDLFARMCNQEIDRPRIPDLMGNIQAELDAARNETLSEAQVGRLVELRSRRRDFGGGFGRGR